VNRRHRLGMKRVRASNADQIAVQLADGRWPGSCTQHAAPHRGRPNHFPRLQVKYHNSVPMLSSSYRQSPFSIHARACPLALWCPHNTSSERAERALKRSCHLQAHRRKRNNTTNACPQHRRPRRGRSTRRRPPLRPFRRAAPRPNAAAAAATPRPRGGPRSRTGAAGRPAATPPSGGAG